MFFCIAIGGDNDVFGDRGRILSFSSGLPHQHWPDSEGLSYSNLKKVLLDTPSADKAREWSRYYTAGPHLAGKNLSQAEWTRDRWEEWGIKSDIAAYHVYINYPKDHRLALLKHGKVDFEATLEEDVLEEDPTTGLDDRVPVFHGYSASGNATAQYVYVNYGTYADFEELLKAGIHLKGKIAIVKYGRIFRGLKVKRAEELGMLGVVIYSDPGDDGEITEEKGYKPYPDGPARHPRSVQRGSVEYLSKKSILDRKRAHQADRKQALDQATQQRLATRPNPASLVSRRKARYPRYHPSRSLTLRQSLFFAPSMDMAQPLRLCPLGGTEAVLGTRMSATTSDHHQLK